MSLANASGYDENPALRQVHLNQQARRILVIVNVCLAAYVWNIDLAFYTVVCPFKIALSQSVGRGFLMAAAKRTQGRSNFYRDQSIVMRIVVPRDSTESITGTGRVRKIVVVKDDTCGLDRYTLSL